MLAPPRPPVGPSPDYQLPPSEYHPCRARPARYPGAIGLYLEVVHSLELLMLLRAERSMTCSGVTTHASCVLRSHTGRLHPRITIFRDSEGDVHPFRFAHNCLQTGGTAAGSPAFTAGITARQAGTGPAQAILTAAGAAGTAMAIFLAAASAYH